MVVALPFHSTVAYKPTPYHRMNISQIKHLLSKARSLYHRRQLKKALNNVHIALDFGVKGAASVEYLNEAKLLLAKIYNTNGRYQNDASFYSKAITYLKDLEEKATGMDTVFLINQYIVTGQVYQNLSEFSQATQYIEHALQLSNEHDYKEGIVKALVEKCQILSRQKQYDEAWETVQKAQVFLETAIHPNNDYLKALVYQQISDILIRRKEYSQALEHSQRLVALARKTNDLEKEVEGLKNIAVVCGVKSNYKIGMQYFLDALKKSEKIGYRKQITQILINIGTIYAHLYNYEEAVRRYEEVLEDYQDILDQKDQGIIYNNLGNINYTTDQLQTAQSYFKKAHNIATQSGFEEMQALSLAQLGRTFLQKNQYQEAQTYANEAQQKITQTGPVNGCQINLLNLAILAGHREEYEKAVDLALQGIDAAKSMKDDATEIQGYKLLAQFYKALQNYKQALHYQIIYSEIQEEFAKEQRNRRFLDIEIRHAIREKEREIEQLTKENELQSLLLEKSDQYAQKNSELLQANEELRQFAYVASHDLKEPLRMIGSYTQILDRLLKDQLDDTMRSYFQYVTDGVGRMNNLLDALLKFATIGNSEEPFEEVDLNKIALLSQYNLKVRIEEKGADVRVGELPQVMGRKTLFLQLFQNLISNALKFQKEGQQPIITISAKENDSEHIICVADNGIGIAPENQKRIFNIFQRLHQRTEFEGTGIGLAICTKIVQRIGGRIWVTSKEGEGASFFFSVLKG